MNKLLLSDCEEILRKLIKRHKFLQPESEDFDRWSEYEARELVADLIIEINKSDAIQVAHGKQDWGK